jgi:type I restriction enzyme S subunit
LISGRDLNKNEFNDRRRGLPYIIGASNFNKGNVLIERWTETPEVISCYGDILLTCKGTVGELAFNTLGDVHIARQVMAIRNKSSIDTHYLMILLEYHITRIKEKAKGLIPGISREDITNLQFVIPPLNEQKRIVSKINFIDNLILEIEASLN